MRGRGLRRGPFLLGFVVAGLLPVASVDAAELPALSELSATCVAAQRFEVGAAAIELHIDERRFAANRADVCDWTVRAALAVAGYFGRFPVARVAVFVEAVDDDGVRTGHTYGDEPGGPRIDIELGRAATRAALDRDWVMTHEMVHLAVPSLAESHHWFEEGLATYVEPLARAARGELGARQIWSDLLSGIPKGLPRAGDRGLDRTPTWGRTYWGGALFCLLADIGIRERTHGSRSLRDAMRGVIAEGGDITRDWPISRVLAAGDRATGTAVLAELYDRMGERPGPAEVDGLWRDLGVRRDGAGVAFDPDARLAALRAALIPDAR